MKHENSNSLINIDCIFMPNSIRVGDVVYFGIKITNLGNEVIVSRDENVVNISYHWIDIVGNIIIHDGLRTPLALDIKPRECIDVDMKVMAPNKIGKFKLLITLVYENKYWLNEISNQSCKILTIDVVHWKKIYANEWVMAFPQIETAKFRPIDFVIETTTVCNNNCIICAKQISKRKNEHMSNDLFKICIDNIVNVGGGEILLVPRIGEILCDPNIFEKIYIAKQNNLAVSIYTNGSLIYKLAEKDLAFLVSNVDRIFISTYGVDCKEYGSMTSTDRYAEFIKSIQLLSKNNIIKSKIFFQFRLLSKKSVSEIESWMFNTLGSIYSYSVCNEFANWAGNISGSRILELGGKMASKKAYKGPCCYPYEHNVIFVNGDVSFCCADYEIYPEFYLGNIKEKPLSKILLDKKIKNYYSGKYIPSLCKQCTWYEPIDKLPIKLKSII